MIERRLQKLWPQMQGKKPHMPHFLALPFRYSDVVDLEPAAARICFSRPARATHAPQPRKD